MQDVQENICSSPTGLRERKRAQTHARIQAEGIRLFVERGFEATTLADIARAAEVSRRTLFHYFKSKEDIVLSAKSGFTARIEQAIAARPADEPLLDMVENAFIDFAAGYQGPGPRAVARLVKRTPALQAGDHAKSALVEQVLARALARRKGLAEDDIDCRVTATAAMGILKMATDAWVASDEDVGPDVFGREAFAALKRVTGPQGG